jgi:expansin (peptidoglycan-binding protein)
LACNETSDGASTELPSPPAPGEAPRCAAEKHEGEGTYYAADGSGNCSFPPSPADLNVAAMNERDYADGAYCGACIAVTGPAGTVTVRIVDRCPECAKGDVDLSPQAFERIAPLAAGRVKIHWRLVGCAVEGPVEYVYKEGSSQWWTGVQVRNHSNPIAKFELKSGAGSYREIERLRYNYFVDEAGFGPGPFTFRVTDRYGQRFEDGNVPLRESGAVPGAGQFVGCSVD